jgi:nudix-type nucleoside diphosphatase (YffH/AdpP family)
VQRTYEVVSVERVFDGFFSVDRAQVRFGLVNGGMSSTHERLSVERGDSAAVLLHDVESDSFLLARQFRYPCIGHGDAWLLEAVAGKIDAGETPEEAVRREAIEEAGYRIGGLAKVGAFYGSPGGLSELTHVFYARVTAADKVARGGGTDLGEDVEIVPIPANEAVRMGKAGEIRDAKALVALLWYAAQNANSQ